MISLRKKLGLAATFIVITVLAALIWLTPSAAPETPPPNPNGCDDFAKAATLVAASTSDWNTLSIEQLRQLVATNEPALALLRAGLAKKCRVVPYSLAGTNSNHLTDLADFKRAAQAFCGASRLALIEGRTNEAAGLALDCIRFGQESTRGGVIIDGLVGIAIQAIGRARLEEALPGTDRETSQKAVLTLDDVARQGETCADIFKREARWARLGRFGSAGVITQLIQPFLQRGLRTKTEQKFAKSLNDLQRTKLHAAAHAYELDHGKPPTTARDLVPQYLKSIPLDLATGRELPLD